MPGVKTVVTIDKDSLTEYLREEIRAAQGNIDMARNPTTIEYHYGKKTAFERVLGEITF